MDMTDKIRIANLERALDKTKIFLEWCANNPCDKGLAEKAKRVLDMVNDSMKK